MTHQFRTVETALTTEFENNERYHIQALCFLNRGITNSTSKNDISVLMRNLKKTRSEAEVISHLQECLELMAVYDNNFERYLQCFPGYTLHKPGMQLPVSHSTFSGEKPTVYVPAAKPETSDMDERLTDRYVMKLHLKLHVDKLKDFAVVGLGISALEYDNEIAVLSATKDKIGEIFKLWNQRAPLDNLKFNSEDCPPYTKRGLRFALKECEHNDAIAALNLQ